VVEFLAVNEVTLSADHVFICCRCLSKDLWETTERLANGKDAGGTELTPESEMDLRSYNSHLQLTLLALGITSQEIQELVELSSDVSR
jgi:hypothetical protein